MSKSHSTNRTVTWLLNIVKLIGLFALYQLAMIPTMMPAIRRITHLVAGNDLSSSSANRDQFITTDTSGVNDSGPIYPG